jgi:hypothetical protein
MNIEQAREVASKALQSLSDSLAQGESEALRNYLAAMGKFHRYSASNILLIMTKRPDATHVAGYQTWRKLHRQVTRGTKGIVIFRRSCAGPWMRMNVGLRASGKASLAIARPWSSMLPTPREIRVLMSWRMSGCTSPHVEPRRPSASERRRLKPLRLWSARPSVSKPNLRLAIT